MKQYYNPDSILFQPCVLRDNAKLKNNKNYQQMTEIRAPQIILRNGIFEKYNHITYHNVFPQFSSTMD